MTLVRFIKNSRNNDTLIAGDFIFRRNKCRDEKVYWKCRKANCPAKITTHNGKVMGHFLRHNHDDTNQEEITRLEGLSPPTNYQVRMIFRSKMKSIYDTNSLFLFILFLLLFSY